jgi:uncharacterized protein
MKERMKVKRALVTGASRGLGKAFAEELAARGTDLALVSLPDSGLPDLARLLEKNWGIEAEWLEIDLSLAGASERVAEWAREDPPDLLVNNAGIGSKSSFLDSSPEYSDTLLKLNVLALVKLTRLLVPMMDGGKILNVASLAAFFPMPYLPVYSPSKSFVLNFSLALREEFKEKGIAVSVVCPNGIRSNRECRDDIERQGLAAGLTCLYPEEVARAALEGLEKGKAIVFPGFINCLLEKFGALAPKWLFLKVVRRYWGPAKRRAQDQSPEMAEEALPPKSA